MKYSSAAIEIIKSELSLFAFLANVIASSFMIIYLIYSSFAGIGFLAINIAICVLVVADLVICLMARKNKKMKDARELYHHVYVITKIVLDAVSLASALYMVIVIPENVSAISLVLLPLTIIMLILRVVCEIVSIYVNSRLTLLVDGVQMDIEPIIKTALGARNIVYKLAGEDTVETNLIEDHNRELLKDKAGVIADKKRVRFKSLVKGIFSKKTK